MQGQVIDILRKMQIHLYQKNTFVLYNKAIVRVIWT